ncbi:hypothetical protein CTV99_03185 [Bacillus pumilus]|uniref:Uncharacterized protein n=1 Tax=Bacillus pumilus TaxID=1408 RepID=A0A2G8IXV7_BACPU|nr:hypothetical protein CTV99_03185 [Bacillus pumilus]
MFFIGANALDLLKSLLVHVTNQQTQKIPHPTKDRGFTSFISSMLFEELLLSSAHKCHQQQDHVSIRITDTTKYFMKILTSRFHKIKSIVNTFAYFRTYANLFLIT